MLFMTRRTLLSAACATPLMSFCTIVRAASPVYDAWGQSVQPLPARRIVSLGADVSEILAMLGVADRIIARDRSSRWPGSLRALPDLGARRALSVEGVVALDGDLILAGEDIGPPEVVDVLRATGITIFAVPREASLHGIERKIEVIAQALGLQARGAQLAAKVTSEYRAAEALSANLPIESRKRTVFFHGLLSLSAAGSGTAAGEMLRAAGAHNIFADHDGYLQASPELVLARDPEIIVMMPDGKGGPLLSEVFAHPAMAETTAAKNGALLLIEDNLMIGFGPRTAGQIGRLAHQLYPDLVPPE